MMIIVTITAGWPWAGHAAVIPGRISKTPDLHGAVCSALEYNTHRLVIVGDEVRFASDGRVYARITESPIVPVLLKSAHPTARDRANAIAIAEAQEEII